MLYSQRNRKPSALVYGIAPEIRILILRAFEGYAPRFRGGFEQLLDQVGQSLLRRIPGLRGTLYEAARMFDHPVAEHFIHCNEEEALDFVELCFQQSAYDGAQEGVDAVNSIFLENDIGFELTRFVVPKVDRSLPLSKRALVEFPRIIRRDRHVIQQEVIEPVQELLVDQRLSVANSEMLNSFTALRNGRHEDAITSAGSAFESLMKTICETEAWPYDQKDTCSRLIKTLKDNGLFPGVYAPILEGVGSVRNNFGDAHGRGPKRGAPVTREYAEHMIQMTSVHMLFLSKLAGF